MKQKWYNEEAAEVAFFMEENPDKQINQRFSQLHHHLSSQKTKGRIVK